MSTRRPRIKAVAALPPRRKNAEITEDSKKKPLPSKDVSEKITTSPRTPRTYSKSEDKPSPGRDSSSPLICTPKETAGNRNEPSPSNTESPKITGITSPKPVRAMPVSVITPTPNFNNKSNVFASPRVINSPDRRALMSPPVMNPPRTIKSVESVQNVPFTPAQYTINSVGARESVQSQDSGINVETVHNTPVSTGNRTHIPDVYNVPSVPESIPDEPVMDGIVPLQAEKSAQKPIDILKNEIISEHAEVLFDPIVPLPSPSKVRPKLRPVPRLAPHRRNSVQGSASESEDESRRALRDPGNLTPAPPRQRHDSHVSHASHPKESSRVRNDSVSSGVSQLPLHPPPALSPVKEKHFTKCRRQEMSKRMWRRRRDIAKRDGLTMYDLIFYNPTTNPFIPDQEELKAKEENAKEAERAAQAPKQEAAEQQPAAAPVPQIKLGPNGEIVLDEESLVINQSDANRKVSSVVREGTWAGSGSGRYTRATRTADWSMAETVRFYRALAAIGTDFTLMAPMFPARTRRDLKLKFKKEERLNGAQVDKALRSATAWDAARLIDEFTEEREQAAKLAEKERQRQLAEKRAEKQRTRAYRERGNRPSRSAKALESTLEECAKSNEATADNFVLRAVKRQHDDRKAERKAERELLAKTPSKPAGERPGTPNSYATLTLLRRGSQQSQPPSSPATPDIATLTRTNPPTPISNEHTNVTVPPNIETGSLVVLRVNNPADPTKTMLQTYISHVDGKLTPINLPSALLNSVVGYMKKGTPKGAEPGSPSPFASPLNRPDTRRVSPVTSLSPTKRARIGSWDITNL